MQMSTAVITTAGTLTVGLLAYATYFDYKRRSDPEFRRSLVRNNRRLARAVREESEAESQKQKETIGQALAAAKEDGFPTGVEEKEAFFLANISKGETLSDQGGAGHIEAALSFYKALKVYPQPKDLIQIYETAVPKDVLAILAEMVAQDSSLNLGASFTKSSKGSESDTGSVE